jgi:predicted dienelactone hydrolase|tara:strand:+ start:113 stop:1120 length:1008 start_codon:yes stop_codon:yes gene_type:complete
MIKGIWATLLSCLLIVGATASAETYVSTQRISTQVSGVEVPIRVFYPTATQAQNTRFGPWELNIAKNAEPIVGSYPLVIISHGLGGNDWNHHLLASRLVEAGFVVAALRHPDDFLRVGEPEHSVLRPLELRSAVDQVLGSEPFSTLIDRNRIGAFGFSAGGYTVLAVAGGLPDRNRIVEHCAIAQNDPEFCIGEEGGERLPLWLRAKRAFYSMPKVDTEQELQDTRIKALVVAAPVGLLFHDLSRITQPTLLIRAGNDQTLRYPYHAQNVHALLPQEHEYMVIENLHHYAFLSPFPDTIASEVGEPAQDPEGFERQEFLVVMNDKITAFFSKNLK